MADEPSPQDSQPPVASTATDGSGTPAPEALKPQADPVVGDGPDAAAASNAASNDKSAADAASKQLIMRRRASYRPSHKATFIGLLVVVLILAINGGAIFYFLRQQTKTEGKTAAQQEAVTINQSALDKLGVNRSSIGDSGVELTINPNTKFRGTVNIGGDVALGGQLKLSNKLVAGEANLTKLEAGDTALTQLNVNGDGTVSNLTLRGNLQVGGTTRLQGDVVMNRLLTVNNSANIAGNLAVGGALTAQRFQATNLVSDTTLTVGGHFITRGQNPGFSPGTAMGSNGTASISGNDAAGTVFAGVGVGANAGLIGTVNFRQVYAGTPHIIVTGAVVSGGGAIRGVYVSRTTTGFSVFVSDPLQAGSYAFDYIVMQ